MSNPPITLPQKTIYFSLPMQMYITQEIKKPIVQGVEVLFSPKATAFDKGKAVKMLWGAFRSLKGLPGPTKSNTWHPNTHILLDIRDWLFQRCFLNDARMGLIRRVMNFIIILYDFDPPWRWIIDSILGEALKKEWKPRGFNDTWVETYKPWWREPNG